MGSGTPPVRALTRALELLDATVRDKGHSNMLQLAEQLGLPKATAHRLIKAMNDAGFLTNIGRGRHVGGPVLRSLAEMLTSAEILAAVARPTLRKLSRKTGLTAHLGVWQGSMVTYLVKECNGADQLFTREGTQLEAYCSAIGKVLLAHLPDEEREAYLDTGPFIALTSKTITRPDALRVHLAGVREAGFALDDREIALDIACVAVPIFSPDQSVKAAISLAANDESAMSAPKSSFVSLLRKASVEIATRLSAE